MNILFKGTRHDLTECRFTVYLSGKGSSVFAESAHDKEFMIQEGDEAWCGMIGHALLGDGHEVEFVEN